MDRAVASGDEHAIKLTEAALRSFGRSADAVLLLAAADAVRPPLSGLPRAHVDGCHG